MPPHVVIEDGQILIFPQGLYYRREETHREEGPPEELVALKQDIMEAIRFTKSKLYLAGCDGKVQAFRPDLRICAMLHDLTVSYWSAEYSNSYKTWLASSTTSTPDEDGFENLRGRNNGEDNKILGTTLVTWLASSTTSTPVEDGSENLEGHNNGDDNKILGTTLVKSNYQDVASNLELYRRIDKVEERSSSSKLFWKTFVAFYEKEQQLDAFPGLTVLFGGLYDRVRKLEGANKLLLATKSGEQKTKKKKTKRTRQKNTSKQKGLDKATK